MSNTDLKDMPKGCLYAIIAFAALAVLGALVGSSKSSGSGSSGGGGGGGSSSFAAEYECNDFVRDRLKSPSTAHFPSDTSSHVGDTWTVSGSVDSENGFGAALRSTFTCTMTNSGDNWHLVNLDFNDGGGIN